MTHIDGNVLTTPHVLFDAESERLTIAGLPASFDFNLFSIENDGEDPTVQVNGNWGNLTNQPNADKQGRVPVPVFLSKDGEVLVDEDCAPCQLMDEDGTPKTFKILVKVSKVYTAANRPVEKGLMAKM